MEEALFEEFQDFSETDDPIITKRVVKKLQQPHKEYTNDDYLSFFKSGKTRKMYWLDLKDRGFKEV